MKTIHTTITIEAPAATVWEHLVDFDAHTTWNPLFASIEGRARTGERLTLIARKGEGTGMRFRPTVLEVDPERLLRWKGKLGFGGLFDGEHSYRLDAIDQTTTTLIHDERFTGLLIPFAGKVLRETEELFVAFNEALKSRAEAAHRASTSET